MKVPVYDAARMTVESQPLSCPRCEAVTPADARFCASCGHALGEASEAALTRKIVARFDVASAPELLASALASYERLGAEPRAAALRARIAESREQT